MGRVLSLGAIGTRNHAARVLGFAEATGLARVTHVHHPGRSAADDPRMRSRLEDLMECDAVFILSPNATHLHYLRAFARGYDGYLFCEKPPVATREDLDALVRLDLPPERTFFDFNMRFGALREDIEAAIREGKLGDLVACSATVTHGLAFRESYLGSWRADAARHGHGVAETAAIHYLDLFAILFGDPTELAYFPAIASKRGTAWDTCRLVARFASGATADVVASYAAPHRTEISVLGTEGVLTVRDGKLEIRGPRSTFDADGLFADPPVISSRAAPPQAEYLDSLDRSVRFFLACCSERRSLPAELFAQSIATTRHLVSLDDRHAHPTRAC